MAPSTFDEISDNITTVDKQQFNLITHSTANPEFLPSGMDSANITPESHKTAVFTIMGILLCISLSVTVAIFVFYKKRNSVFSLYPGKDGRKKDYELDDMNTEGDSATSDRGSMESVPQPEPSVTVPLMERLCEYDKDSILYIPYIPDDQSKSDFYQLLPKSKSFSSEAGHLHVIPNSKGLTDSQPSVLSSVLRSSKKNNASCLPLSRSYSCSNFGNNYQSTLVSAETEQWVSHCDSNTNIKEGSGVCNDVCDPRCHHIDSYQTSGKRTHHGWPSSGDLLCGEHYSEEDTELHKQQDDEEGLVVNSGKPQEVQSTAMNQATFARSDLPNPFSFDCHDYTSRQIIESWGNPHTCERSDLIKLRSNQNHLDQSKLLDYSEGSSTYSSVDKGS